MADENKTPAPAATAGTDTNNSQALDGQGGPNRTPAFSKKDNLDENTQRANPDDIDSASEGAAAHSAFTVSAETEAALGAGEAHDDDSTQYACPTISNLRIGKFQFTHGRLNVKPEDAEQFSKLLSGASSRTQQAVFKIDREGGEAVARKFIEQNKGSMTRGGDTTANTVPAPKPAAA